MTGSWREYSPAVVFSLALHGAMVLAVVLLAQISLRRPLETIKPLALDAVVIDSRTLHMSAPEPAPAPAPAQVAAPAPAPITTPAPATAPPIDAAALVKRRITEQRAQEARVAAEN